MKSHWIVLAGALLFGCADLSRNMVALSSENREEREAAVERLARGGPDTVRPLVRAMSFDDATRARGARVALEGLVYGVASDEREAVSLAVFEEVLAPWPMGVRKELLRILSLVAGDEVLPGLEALIRQEPGLSEDACWCLGRIPGEAAHGALRALIDAPGPASRIALLQDLARRKDPTDAPLFRSLVASDDLELRLAAFQGLAVTGGLEDGAWIWQAALDDGVTPAFRRAGLAAYTSLADSLATRGSTTEAARLYEKLLQEGPEVWNQSSGLDGLCAIRGEEAAPLLLKEIAEGPPDLAGHAVALLSRMRGERVTRALGEGVLKTRGNLRAHLIHALLRRVDGGAVLARESIVQALSQAEPEEKASILEALGAWEDAVWADTFLKATWDADEDVVKAALEALAPLGLDEASPRLEELAQNGRPLEKAAALDAYLRLGESRLEGEPEAARAVFARALAWAEDPEGKKRSLTLLADAGKAGAVPLIRPFLDDPDDSVKQAASSVLAPMAVESEDRALLEAIVARGVDAKGVALAARKLRAMGFQPEVPIRKGCVDRFWVIGPFPGREDLMTCDPIPMDTVPDLNAPVEYGGETFRWKFHALDQIHGMLDLIDVVGDAENVGAYVYAEVYSAREQDCLFKIGSDDDVYCRLNGVEVHRFEGGRGWSPDQDVVKVHLKAGKNTVLFKVLNGGGGWAVSLCITDLEEEP